MMNGKKEVRKRRTEVEFLPTKVGYSFQGYTQLAVRSKGIGIGFKEVY